MWYALLYVVIYSTGSVLVQKLYLSIPTTFTLMVAAFITALFFNLVNLKSIGKIHVAFWQQKRLWLAIMVTILIMWFCTMTGTGALGASLYNFLYFASVGTLGFLSLGLSAGPQRVKLYFGLLASALIGGVLAYNCKIHWSVHYGYAIAMPIVGAVCSFIYFKQSRAVMVKSQLSASQVLAMRFYLTIILLFFITPHTDFVTYGTLPNLGLLTLLAALTLIAPMYFLQRALGKITSEQSAIIISLTPMVTAVLQEAAFQDVDFKYLIIYFAYTLILLMSYGFSYFATPKKSGS